MQQFDSRSPVDLLQDIFLLKTRMDKGEAIEMPLLTFMLHNKQSLSGFLMDFRRDNNQAYHLSVELEGSRNLFVTETFFIQGIIIHEIEKVDYLLTEIKPDKASGRGATRLELKNRMNEESKKLSAYFGKNIELQMDESASNSNDFFFIKNLIIDISMTLQAIGEEEPGKSAIAESIEKITLGKGDSLAIKLEGKGMTFNDTLARSYTTNQQRASLYQAIVDVL